MILSTIIILIFIASLIHGYRRGFISMVVSIFTYFFAFVGAKIISPIFASGLVRFFPTIEHGTPYTSIGTSNLTTFFYNGISFIICFAILTIIIRMVLRRLNWFSKLPILGTIDRWIGALLNFLVVYILIYILLVVFQLYPAEWWQLQFANSEIAQLIIKNTPTWAQLIVNSL
ncbi:CvpA family protein [Lactobacillaceae bacterium 24-114]